MWANTESEGIDISGLSSTIGQLTPYQAPNWEEVGTDEMRLIRTRVELSGNQNRPTLNGVEINLLDYTESLLAGFINIYQLLLDRRDELLDKNGLIERFTKDEVRVIFRSTLDYNWLLAESFHPHVLQNALERDRLFDHLWEEVKQQSYLTKVIEFEQNDLWQGDIPIFTTYPGSRSIWNSSYEQVADFFNESGMELVKRRFQQLSEQNLRRQLWFIRASLTTSITVEEPIQWPSYSPIEPANCINRQLLLTAAQLVGARLEALALCNGQEASWIGLTLLNEKHWTLSALGFDLYDGIPGVTLFLAYLGATTHQNRYTVLAKAALATLQRQLDTSHESIVSIGGFQGWGGIIYLLTQLGILWNEPALLDQAESLVKRLPVLILKDRELDIIGGTAGCLGSLMSLYCCRPAQSILTAAIQCGDHLIAQAQTMPQGIGWFPKGGKSQPLAGFAHGVAGITWALLQLSVLTADTRFRAAAIAGIAYERSIFCPSNGNWFDTHSFADTVLTGSSSLSSGRTAWCHGTPGIGLARLCSLPHFNDAEIQAEIDTALKNTLENGFCGNHSLCHGDLGNLELLLQASQSFGSITWQKHVDRLSATILESIDQHGWLCGVPMGVETPGLMTGLAGIGYELLRLAEPGRVPSVLNLAPPIANV
jgi:type 2 lantibiotic biosynthesis protein LanM